MAKSVHEKKKRIAHNKAFENDNVDANDILSNIMGAMDNKHTSVYSSKFENDLFESSRTFSQNKDLFTEIKKPKQKCVPKSKKFGLSRKFPLMEKTQRTLKQIRHNREMPKPRAHLAGFSDSVLPCDNSMLVEKPTVTAKRKNVKSQNKKVSNVTVHRKEVLSGSVKKKEPIKQSKNENIPNKNKPKLVSKNGTLEESRALGDYKSNDDSSDNDFEKFIQREKKDLPKPKCKKNVCQNRKPKNTNRKRASKTISSSEESESEMSSEEYESPKQYYKSNKRRKNTNKVLKGPSRTNKVLKGQSRKISSEEKSESEMDFDDDQPYHDTSSENDDLSSLPSNNNSCDNKSSKNTSNKPKSVPVLKSPTHETQDIPSLINGNQFRVLPKTRSITSIQDQPNAQAAPTASIVGNARLNAQPVTSTLVDNRHLNELKAPLATSLVNNTHHKILNKAADNSQPNATVKIESSVCDTVSTGTAVNCSASKLSDKPSVIDLTESDNECENIKLPKIVSVSGSKKNELPSHSDDESECEVVDVILQDLPKDTKCSVKNTEPTSVHTKNIKTEKVNRTVHSTGNPHNKINTHSNAEIAVEKANISGKCNRNAESKENVPIKLENSLVLNKKVKEEPPDDCVILDNVPSTSNLNNITDEQNCNLNIKKEKVSRSASSVHVPNSVLAVEKNKSVLKKEKLQEACSKFPVHNEKETLEKESANVPSTDELAAKLEALKKEFSTYQQIVQAEKSIESTFKAMERHQAERLTMLKTEITQLLIKGGDNGNAIKSAMHYLNSEISSKSCEDSVKVPSDLSSKHDLTLQDLQTVAEMNIVPLSSISEKDIKPDVSVLQRVLKSEASTLNESNNMSFGEKCIVCAKDAAAACQRCAKVFFCSNECGVKYWESGHKNACVK